MRLPAAIALTALLASACTGGPADNVAVPRQRAYPRPALPDTVLTAAPSAPLYFLVNADAALDQPREDWLNIHYPTLGVTVHTSFTPTTPDKVQDVMANRMQRLLLNAGQAEPRFTESVNAAGFDIVIAQSETGVTPLQFLATDNSGWVVSGAARIADGDGAANVDSLRPIINAVRHDLERALAGLRPQ